ncbi:oxidoreductase-like protein [Marasmius fiardii PR-910]|nr:oxidoreductase-like protein [Marasmius fiardii PR-910]
MTFQSRFETGHVMPPQNQKLPGIQSAMDSPPPQSEYIPDWDGGYRLYRAAGKLDGRKTLITGGNSGIGRAIAILFAMEGADNFITYLPEEKEEAQDTRAYVEKYGRRCHIMQANLNKKENCKKVIEEALAAMGTINFLINNQSSQFQRGDITKIPENQWEHTFNTNIYPFFYLSECTLPHMKRGDSIINSVSTTAFKGSPDLLDYSSTKGAIVAFTRALSNQYAGRGIRVNCVAPGPVYTPLIPPQ